MNTVSLKSCYNAFNSLIGRVNIIKEHAEGMSLDEIRGEAVWVGLRYEERRCGGVKRCKSTVEIWTHDKKKRLAASGVCGVNAKRHYDRLNSYFFG